MTIKFQTNMASIQEMLIGDEQEETEEKIDTKQGFPHLPNPPVMKTTCRSKLFYSSYYILCIYLS
jgi:hypothetical protein